MLDLSRCKTIQVLSSTFQLSQLIFTGLDKTPDNFKFAVNKRQNKNVLICFTKKTLIEKQNKKKL